MASPLALTLGEPAGIGPDITFAAWRARAELELTPFYLIADPEFIARRARAMASDVSIAVVEPAAASSTFKTALPVVDLGVAVSAESGRPDRSSAPAALAAIRRAVADVVAGAAAAIVTIRSPRTCSTARASPSPGTPNFSPSSPLRRPASMRIR